MSAPLIEPGAVIGILGGGQLGRMMAIAAAELGYLVHIYTPERDTPASQVAYKTTVAKYDNKKALLAFAKEVSVITYEFENVPHESMELLEEKKPVFPSARILKISRNRFREKTFISKLGIGTAEFRRVTNISDLNKAVREIGLPAILKTAELGYDGKGQVMLKANSNLCEEWDKLETEEAILEGVVDFHMEISVLVARGADKNSLCYVPVENTHKHGILRKTIAPARIEKKLVNEAQNIAVKIADALNLRGLLAVEMFVTRDGLVLVNEIAPRPHNSGHWTIEACVTTQFEQAIRAVCGLTLGSVEVLCAAEMINLIGDDVANLQKYLSNKNAKLHLYGKKDIRAGRKMGHVNILHPK